MYHLIVYTIKPDVNAKLLLRSITYICDPVHLYCIASITEEASATSGATPSASPASRRRSSPCAPRRTSASTTCRWWPPTPAARAPRTRRWWPCASITSPAPSTTSSRRASPWWSPTAGSTPSTGSSARSGADRSRPGPHHRHRDGRYEPRPGQVPLDQRRHQVPGCCARARGRGLRELDVADRYRRSTSSTSAGSRSTR